MVTQNKRLTGIILFITLILLIPLIAMQFTEDVNWSVFDFLVAGILLVVTGLAFELTIRKVKKKQHRLILLATIIILFLLTWIELAVGLFGTPLAGS